MTSIGGLVPGPEGQETDPMPVSVLPGARPPLRARSVDMLADQSPAPFNGSYPAGGRTLPGFRSRAALYAAVPPVRYNRTAGADGVTVPIGSSDLQGNLRAGLHFLDLGAIMCPSSNEERPHTVFRSGPCEGREITNRLRRVPSARQASNVTARARHGLGPFHFCSLLPYLRSRHPLGTMG